MELKILLHMFSIIKLIIFIITDMSGMTEECLLRKHLKYEMQLVNEYQRGSSEWAVWRRRASHGLHAAPVTACRRHGPPLGPAWTAASVPVIDTQPVSGVSTKLNCAIYYISLRRLVHSTNEWTIIIINLLNHAVVVVSLPCPNNTSKYELEIVMLWDMSSI